MSCLVNPPTTLDHSRLRFIKRPKAMGPQSDELANAITIGGLVVVECIHLRRRYEALLG